MSMLVKRDRGVLEPHGPASYVGAGMVVAPLSAMALAFILPGGLFFWLLVMMVVGAISY